jgi:hypothetical protein
MFDRTHSAFRRRLAVPVVLALAGCGSVTTPDTRRADADTPPAALADATAASEGDGDADLLDGGAPVDAAVCPTPFPCVPDASCFDGCNWWTCNDDAGSWRTTDLICPSGDAGLPPPPH